MSFYKKNIMILIKIDRSTIRKNPDRYDAGSFQKRPRVASMTIHFQVTDKKLINGCSFDPEVDIPGWKKDVNYMITEIQSDGENFICRGFAKGEELLELYKLKNWDGVNLTIEKEYEPEYISFRSDPEYLYNYEALPERITCPHCDNSFKSEHIGAEVMLDEYDSDYDDRLCPICQEKVVEYEDFKTEMVLQK